MNWQPLQCGTYHLPFIRVLKGTAARQHLVHVVHTRDNDGSIETLLRHPFAFAFNHSLLKLLLTMCLLQINDENASPFYDANVAKYAGKDGMGGLSEEDFTAANLKHAINGRLFCNLEGLIMKSDQKIRWHTAVLVGSPAPAPLQPITTRAFNDNTVWCYLFGKCNAQPLIKQYLL